MDTDISKEEVKQSLDAIRKTNAFILLTKTNKPVKMAVTKSKYKKG